MASIWSVGSVDLYNTQYDPSGDVKLAKHTPLDSNASSTIHFFGSGAEEVSLGGMVFSEANVNTLKGYRDAGTTVTLITDQGSAGSFIIQTFEPKRFGPVVSVHLSGYPTDTTPYRYQMKLIKVS